MIRVEGLPVGEMGVNCYFVEDTDTRRCLIVDPGAQGERILARLGERTACAVLLTHGHFDHIGAVDEVCEALQIPLYIHRGDLPKLTSSEANMGAYFGVHTVVRTPGLGLDDGDVIEAAGFPVKVLHTPGHSDGSACFLLPDGAGILTGDTLFAHGYGRTDFPDGSFAKLRQSLRMLFNLTPRMTAWPGHEEAGITGRDPEENT